MGIKRPGSLYLGVRVGEGKQVKEWGGFVLKHFWSFPESKLKVRKGITFLICLSVSLAFKLN